MKARQPTILHTIKLQRTYKVCPHKNVTQVISIYTKPVYTICKSHPHSFPPNPSPSALLHGKHNYFLSAHTHTQKSTSHTHTHTYIHTHTHTELSLNTHPWYKRCVITWQRFGRPFSLRIWILYLLNSSFLLISIWKKRGHPQRYSLSWN